MELGFEVGVGDGDGVGQMGQSMDSFGQWKAILHLMCQCHDAVSAETKPYGERNDVKRNSV